jgi:hypothetical protein
MVRMGQTLRLCVSAAANEREEEFPLPAGWAVSVCPPRDAPALPASAIAEALANPIGAEPIAQAARGADRAVLLVDDFRRPTPAEPLCWAVVAELQAAGLRRDQISIILGSGAHRPMTRREIRARLGTVCDLVGRVVSHDAFSPQVTFLGLTPAGTPVLVNEAAAGADFSVTISSVYPHGLAAWAGGAKMVVPGIAHISTIHCHHRRVPGGPRGGSPGRCPARLDIEAAGRLFGLSASLCAVVNSRRELCGLYYGDPTRAHRAAVPLARRVGDTPVGGDPPDLVIANAYPFDADGSQYDKAQAPALQFGCPMLLLNHLADPSPYHGLYHGPLRAYRRRSTPQPPERTDDLLMNARVFLYSPQCGRGFAPADRSWYCDNDWPQLMAAMSRRFPRAVVVVLPAAPLQLPRTV